MASRRGVFQRGKVAPRLATLSISDTGSRSLFSIPIHHGRSEKLSVNTAFLISLDRTPFRSINSRSEEKTIRDTSAPWEATNEAYHYMYGTDAVKYV